MVTVFLAPLTVFLLLFTSIALMFAQCSPVLQVSFMLYFWVSGCPCLSTWDPVVKEHLLSPQSNFHKSVLNVYG